MIIYQNTKAGFLEDVFTLDIEDVVHQNFMDRTGRRVSPSEVASWTSSLVSVGRVLNTPEIPGDCGLAIEYTIPQTSKRVDALLTGLNDGDHPSVVIIELKQWSEAMATERDAIVQTRFKGRLASRFPQWGDLRSVGEKAADIRIGGEWWHQWDKARS